MHSASVHPYPSLPCSSSHYLVVSPTINLSPSTSSSSSTSSSPAPRSTETSPVKTIVMRSTSSGPREIAWKFKIVKVQVINDFISKIIQFDPNFAWPMVNKHFRSLTPRVIAQCYPPYYYMILGNYLKMRVPLLKYADYTPDTLTRTLPLGILTNFKAAPIFDCYWGWDERTLEAKRTEVKSYSDYDFKQIRYFLSLSPNDRLTLPKIKTLRKDPQYLSCMLRYIFDQIYSEAAKRIRYPNLYDTLPIFFEEECDAYLSFEDWHYVLLIHIHTVLTRPVEIHERNLKLIGSILNKMKSKNKDFTDLKRHLQALLSPVKQKSLVTEIQNLHISKRIATAYFKQNFLAVKNVLQEHFPELPLDTGCCTIL